jgi:hypothetical protein
VKVRRGSGGTINCPICSVSIAPWRAKQSMSNSILRAFLRFVGRVFELDNGDLDAEKNELSGLGRFSNAKI